MATKKIVLGQEVEVSLTKYALLMAVVDGQEYTAASWDELEVRLKKALTIARVERSIPVVVSFQGKVQRMVLRGQKTGSRDGFLFTLPDGTKKVLHDTRFVALGEEMTDEQIAEQNRLNAEADKAVAAANHYRYAIQRPSRKHYGLDGLLSDAADADLKAAEKAGQ